jgi:hypothetical protein
MEDIVDLSGQWKPQSESHRADYLSYFKWPFPSGCQLPRGIMESQVVPFKPYLISDFPRTNFDEICSHMVRCTFSCAAKASFRASSNSDSLDSRAGRNIFPIGG